MAMANGSSAAQSATLAVFWHHQRVGTLYPTEPLSFSYDAAWLEKQGRPLAPGIPLQADRQAAPDVHAFFENLLPEGEQRRLISVRHHVSSVYGLLRVAGGDMAGALMLLPDGQMPEPPCYQPLTWNEVDALIHVDQDNLPMRQEIEAKAQAFPAPRLSISGAQVKMLLSLDAQGNPLRPMGSTPSTHILKPDILRTDIHLFATAANETLVMQTAALCRLHVARVFYQPVVNACLVERYDRVRQADGALKRLWQADFCQLLGYASDVKYEADGGPTFADCFNLVKRFSAEPASDQRQLLCWLFFNLYIGNNDSHAKNLSMIETSDGLRLAPFYDLMSTRVYAGLGTHFAFSVGGESEPGKLGAAHLVLLAKELRISARYVAEIAMEVADRISMALPQAAQAQMSMVGPSQVILVQRVLQKVESLVRQARKRLS